MSRHKLCIGTVNFGRAYGIAPESGQVSAEDATAIVNAALKRGIDRFDTAAGYGAAETVLGASLKQAGATKSKVIGKLPPVGEDALDDDRGSELREAAERSRRRLGAEALDGLLVHRTADLLGDDGERLWKLLEEFKEQGIARRIGVSLYEAEEIDAVLERFAPDIVQLPLSIADQRLLRSGHLSLLADRGVEVHARSIFLQGVLLTDPADTDRIFSTVSESMAALDALAGEMDLDRLGLCLGFASGLPEVTQIVVGVDSETQLHEIADAAAKTTDIDRATTTACAWSDPGLLNPSHWPALQAEAATEA